MTYPEQEPPLPHRRAAITRGIRTCEEIALLSACAIQAISSLKKLPSLRINTMGYAPDSPFRLINEHHPNNQDGSIHNLGVAHIKPFFRQHKEFFEQAISDCDALLLEGNIFSYPEYQNPLARAFFEQCVDTAVDHQKTMYFIDRYLAPLIFLQKNFSLPLTLLTTFDMSLDTKCALKKFHHDSQKGKSTSVPLLSNRRNFMRALAGIGLGSAWLMRTPDTDNPEEYDGYIQRGRSAIMMRNILTISETDPTAKLLTITGDAHAQLFEHYFENPDLLTRDLRSYRVHDAVYGLPMQSMQPGDLEPKPL